MKSTPADAQKSGIPTSAWGILYFSKRKTPSLKNRVYFSDYNPKNHI